MEKLIALFKEENFTEIEKLIDDHQDYVSSVITKLEQVKWIYRRNTGTLRNLALTKAPFLVKSFDDCKWLYKLVHAGSKLIVLDRAESLATTIPEFLWIYERSNLPQKDSLLSKIELMMTSFTICNDTLNRSDDETIKNLAIRKATRNALTPENIVWIVENSPGRVSSDLLAKANETLKTFKDCQFLYKNSVSESVKNIAILAAKRMITKFKHCKWFYKKLENLDQARFLNGEAIDYAVNFLDYVWIYKEAMLHADPILMARMIEKIELLMISFSQARWLYYNTRGSLRDYAFIRAKEVSVSFDSLLGMYVSGENEFGKLYKTKLQESFTTYEEYETMLVLCDGLASKVAKGKINRILWN